MKRVIIAFLSLVLFTGEGASDWKWIGGAKTKGDTDELFIDANSMKLLPDGHAQVWSKTLSENALNKAKPSDAVLGQAAGRLRYSYAPPVM
jgi:hypothetical protein